MSTIERQQRILRERARGIHAAVNRVVTATKREPNGPWKERRKFASFLNETATLIGVINRDKENWRTTASVVLRKYNDLIQGIGAEPHAESCPVFSAPGKAECSCWKKRVYEFKNEAADA